MSTRDAVLVILLGICLLAATAAGTEGETTTRPEPKIEVRWPGGQWGEQTTTDIPGGGTWVELKLTNPESDMSFDEDDAEVTPHKNYNVEFTVIGTALSYGGQYDMPITANPVIGGQEYDPWGNLNDGNNPRTWVCPDTFEAETSFSLKTWCWYKSWYGWNVYRQVDSPDYPGVRVHILRDGDSFPDVPGYLDQPSAEEYLQDYLTSDGIVTLGDKQAIFLFEYTSDLDGSSADHQDLVVLASLMAAEDTSGDTSFHFSGPTADDGWSFTYYRNGSQVSNEFDLQLAPQESKIVRVWADPNGWPGNYVYPDFSLTCQASDGSTLEDVASANLLLPGDLMFADSTGNGTIMGSLSPWDTQQQATQTFQVRSHDPRSFDLTLQNVHDATVRYRLQAERRLDKPLLCRFYLEGEDVTQDILSESGYTLPTALSPGGSTDLTLEIVPVGHITDERQIVIAARIAEVVDPVPAGHTRLHALDAARAGVAPSGNRLRIENWREVEGENTNTSSSTQ
jgi:hypothetical protein